MEGIIAHMSILLTKQGACLIRKHMRITQLQLPIELPSETDLLEYNYYKEQSKKTYPHMLKQYIAPKEAQPPIERKYYETKD